MHEEVAQGQLLAGKYRIERVLGRGGMGVVVAAHHIVLDQTPAQGATGACFQQHCMGGGYAGGWVQKSQ